MNDAQPRPDLQPRPDSQPQPVACTLGSGDLAGRLARWKAVAARAAGERTPTDHGVRLSFTAAPGVATELRELAALEADCCAFATWTVREDGHRVLVEVNANTPEGAGAIQAMFAALAA